MSSAPDGTDTAGSLGELQRWFHGRVISPNLTGESSATKALAAAASAHEASEVVLPSATLAPDQRMDIYSGMYFIRIVESLSEDYPTVRAVVGAERFRGLVRRYLARFPSRSFTLDHTGDDFPDYLADCPELDHGPLLADVARLERAINHAFLAASSEVLSPRVIGQVAVERWPELSFRMTEAVQVLAFDHRANDFVSAVRQDEELPPFAPQPSWTAVWRKDFVVWRQTLSEPMHALLAALLDGSTVAAAVAAAQAVWPGKEDELEEKLFEWFADWLREGFFSAIVLPPGDAPA